MKIAPVADVKTHFSKFLDECRRQPVVVTRSGRPAAILVPVADDDDLERLVLACSPRFRRLMEEADERARSGEGVEHEAFRRGVEAAPRPQRPAARRRKRR
ncbi:MAG: type II toxin-antitoxin system Phd/YefM family antitoxin [Deltaproteobacteria bacterium]|nr:type II toxin-antitoxin system Phd/YefM family antitoxin [Deltaproteobacteria bacterium]